MPEAAFGRGRGLPAKDTETCRLMGEEFGLGEIREIARSRATALTCLYAGGVAQARPGSRPPAVVSWGEAEAVFISLVTDRRGALGSDIATCTVCGRDGTTIPMHPSQAESTTRAAYLGFALHISRKMADAYDAGTPVIAGAVQVDQDGVTLQDGMMLPWRGIRSVMLTAPTSGVPNMTTLVIFTLDEAVSRHPHIAALNPAGVPNAVSLGDLIAHAARQQEIPVALGWAERDRFPQRP